MKRFLTVLVCTLLIVMGNALYLQAGDITDKGMSQKDLVQFLTNTVSINNEAKADYNLLRAQLLNRAYGPADVAVSGATITIATAFDYTINGVFYNKAITYTVALTADSVQSISTYASYLLSIDSSGTVYCERGPAVSTDVAVLPSITANRAPFAYFRMITGPSFTFTSGTTSLEAADMSETFYNISVMNSGASASSAVAASDLSLTGL